MRIVGRGTGFFVRPESQAEFEWLLEFAPDQSRWLTNGLLCPNPEMDALLAQAGGEDFPLHIGPEFFEAEPPLPFLDPLEEEVS